MTMMNARLAATRAVRYAATRRPLVQSRYATSAIASSRRVIASSSQNANDGTNSDASWRLAAAAALAVAFGVQQNNKADCCGIAGVVATEHHDAR